MSLRSLWLNGWKRARRLFWQTTVKNRDPVTKLLKRMSTLGLGIERQRKDVCGCMYLSTRSTNNQRSKSDRKRLCMGSTGCLPRSRPSKSLQFVEFGDDLAFSTNRLINIDEWICAAPSSTNMCSMDHATIRFGRHWKHHLCCPWQGPRCHISKIVFVFATYRTRMMRPSFRKWTYA